MATRRFSQVDVFSPDALGGNPLAVVHDGDGVPEETMAAFARWTNLSETTFLLPPSSPEADYRVRIFTPGEELPFAGHPTVGSARAWLDAGGRPRTPGEVVQECRIGLVRLRLRDGGLAFAAPELLRSGPVEPDLVAQALASLGLDEAALVDAAWVDNGPGWMGLLLRDAATVLAARPDEVAMGDLRVGIIGPHPAGGPADVEVRAFVPGVGVIEDPVTGSVNAGLARWLIGAGRMPGRYTVAQGTALRRTGRLLIETDGETIWVGGPARTLITGTVEI
ncbi:PhzF family phenazine biosynthesis protein [Georgenia faecalis]|uniref:PhzF family phenazine biosynthesis protein n=1 Tax=Georgenia faecalis TaxID=2483799 RepID=UPI000FD8C99D|nr:PhzF family phenazine biosynthesis protein [Georgenia faecalis]